MVNSLPQINSMKNLRVYNEHLISPSKLQKNKI